MPQCPNHPTRNTLGPAYTAAEALYDNAVALSQLLDAYSKRDRCPELTADAYDYLTHNIINAEENLALLRHALATHTLDTRCHWRHDEPFAYWESSCGNTFQFIDGGPADNDMTYCPYCGQPIANDTPTPDTGETPWPPNADSAAAAAPANSPIPTGLQPAAPSTTSATNGDSTCPPTAAHSAATTT